MSKYCKGGGCASEIDQVFPSACGSPCGEEREFWDSVAMEPARLAGVTVALYSLRRAANRHPLYKEASVGGSWEYAGPWEMPGSVEYQRFEGVMPEATESGKRTSRESTLWVARKEFELVECPAPKEGDVVQFWGTPPFGPVKSETYWSVVKAGPDGEYWDTAGFVMYRFDLRQKGKFLPVRKVENSR